MSRNVSSKELMLTNIRNALINKSEAALPQPGRHRAGVQPRRGIAGGIVRPGVKAVSGQFVFAKQEQNWWRY